ncbi:MAG TPA: ABC transporter permease [Bryobacteraceae bacterium]|jgi:predicted permease|nr:ABC transporter permease [Bryobacteraceae bacterium]
MRELWRRLRWWAHRDQHERELEEEMRQHLALKAEERGSIEAASRQFGNVTLWKENSRAVWMWNFWEQFGQDLRYGLRTMGAHKLFTAMAAVSLALGIGANTAIYSFMDAILIRAMPVRQPEELTIVNWRSKGDAEVAHNFDGSAYTADGVTTSGNFPYPAYELLRDHNHVFSKLFAHTWAGRLNLVADGQPYLAEGEYVSGGFFDGLGVRPAAGRLIGVGDDRAGAAPVVAISYSFWQGRLGGSADVAGRSISINGRPFTIVGVASPGFRGVNPESPSEVFVPVHDLTAVELDRNRNLDEHFTDGNWYWIEMMGRLKPGVNIARAEAELRGLFAPWVRSTAQHEKELASLPALFLEEGGSGVDSLRRQYSKPLFILMAMVGLILAIACANIANLLLSRAEIRRREMAVRLSLGAGRLRIMRQLVTESILLSITGGLLGVGVAAVGIRALTLLLANGNPDFTLGAELDVRVLIFTLLVALATGLLFGLAPAIQGTRVDITPALKETRASEARGRMKRFGVRFGLSQVLVVSQIAISLLLVAAAGLFVRTLRNLNSVNLGFNREHVLLFNLNAAQAGYDERATKQLYADLQARFRSIPGVRDATLSHMPMVADWTSTTNVIIPGMPTQATGLPTAVTLVGPRFFETMQIPILLGRAIDERDREGAQNVAVVNEVFAKKYFPGISAVARHFAFGRTEEPQDVEIVGVAKAARYSSLKKDIPPVVYTPYLQAGKTRHVQWMYFELRTAGDPLAAANTVRQIVHQTAPRVPVADVTTQSSVIDKTIVHERTFADLCSCFGALALAMACLGLYGTMAYAVSRRTGEIGIRMALGAQRRRVVGMVLREVLAMGSVGLAIGLAAAWETTAFLKSFLFGVTPTDPLTLGSAVAILIACAILAGYRPAARASRVDPMKALRHE